MPKYKKYGDIEIFEGELTKHEYPWHYHDSYTIIIPHSGSLSYEFRDSPSYHIKKGDIGIIAPAHIHRNIIKEKTHYTAIFLPEHYIERLLQDENRKIANQKIQIHKLYRHLIHSLHFLDAGGNNVYTFISRIYQLTQPIWIRKKNPPLQREYISDIVHSIQEDIVDTPAITELAQTASLSKYHFQRTFKKNTGLTVHQLKQLIKTTKAKKLLEQGSSATEVAHHLGYHDQSHFIKYFKKMWAISPKKIKP